jgi:hypothetical protein
MYHRPTRDLQCAVKARAPEPHVRFVGRQVRDLDPIALQQFGRRAEPPVLPPVARDGEAARVLQPHLRIGEGFDEPVAVLLRELPQPPGLRLPALLDGPGEVRVRALQEEAGVAAARAVRQPLPLHEHHLQRRVELA